jgi:hypothetical protein
MIDHKKQRAENPLSCNLLVMRFMAQLLVVLEVLRIHLHLIALGQSQ